MGWFPLKGENFMLEEVLTGVMGGEEEMSFFGQSPLSQAWDIFG